MFSVSALAEPIGNWISGIFEETSSKAPSANGVGSFNTDEEIAKLQEESGIFCSSYGTYFRLGVTPTEEFPAYIQAAKILGTNILRLWCGNKSPQNYTEEEKEAIYAQGREVAKMAEEAGVILCME